MFGGGDSNLVRILIFSLTSAGSTSHRVASSAVKRLFGEVVQSQSWLKVATTAFTFKTLLRHYAKQFHVYLPWGQRPFSVVSQ